jgi:lipoate-protein ligase A
MAGSAQRRTKKGILHQGSISFEVSKGDKDRLSEELIKGFAAEFNVEFENFTVPDAFTPEAEELSSAKFATEEWNKSK